MTDSVARFLFESLDIRGAMVHLGSAWRAMHHGRGYSPTTRDLLGQMAAVTTLLGNNMKAPGRLSFQVQGHGAVRLLVVDCDEQLHLRGMAKAAADLLPASVPQLLGDGRLVLTLQADAARETPYQSIVPLQGDTLAAIFEHYLAASEQTPTRLWLVADGIRACGLLLQKLPEAERKDADGWNRVQQLAATVTAEELAMAPDILLARLFPEEDIRLFASRRVNYHCPRDEGKVLDMLRSLGRDEVASILDEKGEILIQDDICNHEYRFGREILEHLFPITQHILH
ncbi:MAG: Hsp33 family molecular chaperone HslO [Rhodocyclaceae bacterium]|nr:Hsp33 family molecular chaperone HslO [Rhodocyclaceae bacterium]